MSAAKAENGLLPTLIIAGAPRSGTTSVFRWLSDHPEVLGSTVKETRYFVDPGMHMFDQSRHFASGGIDGYRKFFPEAERPPRLIVEATPGYLYSDLAIRELPLIASRPHFLFILREPVSQIQSIFRYFQSNWNWIPASMSFPAFLSASDSGTHQFGGNELAQNALRNAAYAEFLIRWREACGADRLHVFLFEEAMSDKSRFMRRLAEQFGIDPAFYETYDFASENQTYSVRSKALQKLNIMARSWLPQGALYKAARTVYRRLNTRIDKAKEQADQEMEITLAKRFQPANQRLAEEFKLNLEPWTAIQRARHAGQSQNKGQHHVSG